MQFRDLAATEASTLIARLLASRSDSHRKQLHAVRAALEAAAQALEAAPAADQDIQTLVHRLTAVVDDESRRAAEELRRVTEEGRRRLDEATAALTIQLDENGALTAEISRIQAEVALLRSELDTSQERGEAAERDLTATVEAHAELERILKATDAELRHATHARTQLETDLAGARAAAQRSSAEADHLRTELQRVADDGAKVRELLEQSSGEGHELRASLDRTASEAREVRGALDRTRADTLELQSRLEVATAEGHELRAALERAAADKHELRVALDGTMARAARLQGQLEEYQTERLELDRQLIAAHQAAADRDALARDLEAASGRMGTLEAALADVRTIAAGNDAAVTELASARARIRNLEAQQAEVTEQARQLQLRLDAALQAPTKSPESAGFARDSRPEESQSETLRWELDRMVSLFDASVRAVSEMAGAPTSGDLLAELVKRLSIQFSRVAWFRLKGNGLEGEHHVGFEDTDITKLVLPVTMDSLATRALQSGTGESVNGPDIAARLGMPFGGAPTSAIALPLILQGTTLGVVYADDVDMPEHARGAGVHETSVGFARLLVSEAAVLLMCHTHELKTLAELRQYANTLLQEAKAMYLADAESGMPPAQLRGRLKANLECASQLYTYRAAMEGTAAAALLDEQIAGEMSGSTPFSRDLADVVHGMASADLGITAEAS